MNSNFQQLARLGALLAIQLFFLMMWGFAGIGKVATGVPVWWPDKFGKTILATVPGLNATFWLLTILEVLAFALAAIALLSGEFLGRKPAKLTLTMLVLGLLIFAMLGFGQWLTSEYVGAQQIFTYFCGTLIALQFVLSSPRPRGESSTETSR